MKRVICAVVLCPVAAFGSGRVAFYDPALNEPDDAVVVQDAAWAEYELPSGAMSLSTMRYPRLFGEFERGKLVFDIVIPEGSGITGVCARVSTFPGLHPHYNRGKTFDTGSTPVSGGGRMRLCLPLDIREFQRLGGPAAFPGRLDGIVFKRRAGSPSVRLLLGKVFVEESGVRVGFSVGNGALAVGDLDDPKRNDPHFTIANDGGDCEVSFAWRAFDLEGRFERKGSEEIRLRDGARVRVDVPRLAECGVRYLEYEIVRKGPDGFTHRREISYGAMRPTGAAPRLFTDGFHFNNTLHVTCYPLEEVDAMLDYYAAAGFDMARAGGEFMCYVAPASNVWRTVRMNAVTDRFPSRNIERTLCLMCPAAWQKAGAPVRVESLGYPNLDYYERYCERFVREQRGRVRFFEDANEVNHHRGWTPENYYPYERAAYRGLKRGNPEAMLLSGSWGGMHGGQNGVMGFQEDYYRKYNHGEYDVIAVHYHGDFESGIGEMLPAKQIADKAGKRWFAHECAIAPLEDRYAAKVLFQKTFHAWANGSIGFTWYNFRNKGYPRLKPETRGEICFGQISHDLYPRGTYIAQNAICGAYRGAKFAGEVTMFPGTMCWRFETAEAVLFPAWASDRDFMGRTAWFATDAQRAEAIDLYGNVRPLAVSGGRVAFAVSGEPSTLRLYPAKSSLSFLCDAVAADRRLILTAGGERTYAYGVRNPFGRPVTAKVSLAVPRGVRAEPSEATVALPADGVGTFRTTLRADAGFSAADCGSEGVAVSVRGDGMAADTVFAVQPVVVSRPAQGARFTSETRNRYISLVEGDPTADGLYWGGTNDLSFAVTVPYPTEDALRLVVEVRDDVHRTDGEGHFMFQGDGFQVMLAVPGQAGGWEIGIQAAKEGTGGNFHVWRSPASCPGEQLVCAASMTVTKGTGSVLYDVRLPLSALGTSLRALTEGTMRLNVLVNDNDGPRREGYMSLVSGSPWKSDDYPSVVFERD